MKEINRRVETKIDVGAITMSFWERFPAVSVKFTDVVVHNPADFQSTLSDTLLVAKTIYADLDLSTLISDTPKINQIHVSSGVVNIETDQYGKGNYEVGKAIGDPTKPIPNLSISGLELDNMKFSYKAFGDPKVYRAELTSAALSGIISQKTLALNTSIELGSNNLVPDAYRSYFPIMHYEGSFSYANESILEWNGNIQLGQMQAPVSGFYEINSGQFIVEAKYLTIYKSMANKVLKNNKIKTITISDGLIHLNKLRYIFNGIKDQKLTFTFDVDNGLKIKEIPLQVKGLGRLSFNGKNLFVKVSQVDLKHKEANAHFEGSFSWPENILNGLVSFSTDVKLLDELIKDNPVQLNSGIIDGQADINLLMHENVNYESIIQEGQLGLHNVDLVIEQNGFHIKNLNATLDVLPKTIKINDLRGTFNQNSIDFSGEVVNLFDYILNESPLEISGEAAADRINLASFLTITSPQNAAREFELTDNVRLDLNLKVQELVQNQFQATKLDVNFKKFGRRIELHKLELNMANGAINGDAKLIQQANNEWYITLASEIANMDVKEAFIRFNNFNQQYITSENLRGKLNANVDADFVFSPDFDVRTESLFLTADLSINDGAIVRYKTLEALSDFVAMEELQHIKFDRLSNTISIRDSKITIPQMDISSSAIDIGLSGTHGFDNSIDYNVSVGLADVLFSRFKQKHPETNPLVRNKKMMIFVHIQGTTEDYEISFEKVRQKRLFRKESDEKPKKKKFEIEFDDI
ncbi:MAG: hypothetical protein PF489_07965 [Salinivirgaceae bacterium]|nr:hypothetical protein [Salinivirgaceae bacterium]